MKHYRRKAHAFLSVPSPASGGTADSQLTHLSSPCKLMRERDHFWGDLKSQGALEPRSKLHLEVKSQRQCTAFGRHCMPCRWAIVSTQSFNLTFLWVHIQCPHSHKNFLARQCLFSPSSCSRPQAISAASLFVPLSHFFYVCQNTLEMALQTSTCNTCTWPSNEEGILKCDKVKWCRGVCLD